MKNIWPIAFKAARRRALRTIECTMVDLAARMSWTGCTSGSVTSSRAVPAALAIRAPATVTVVADLDLGHGDREGCLHGV